MRHHIQRRKREWSEADRVGEGGYKARAGRIQRGQELGEQKKAETV